MADIEIPTRLDLMYPTLVAVRDMGGSATKSELLEKVPEIAEVTDEQLAVVFSADYTRLQGKSKVLYEISWAFSCLKSIGALENSQRGVWSITQKGLDYLDMDEAEGAMKRDHSNVAREKMKAQAGQQLRPVEHDEGRPEDQGDEGEFWKDELLGVLQSMDPSAFERLSMRLVKEAGFRYCLSILSHLY